MRAAVAGAVIPGLQRSEAALLLEVACDVLAAGAPRDNPWAPLVEGGWIGVGIEEVDGGHGGTIVEAAALAEALGKTAAELPLLEAVLAAQLAAGAVGTEELLGQMVTGEIRATLVPRVVQASRVRDGYAVLGDSWITPWARSADLVLMLATTDQGLRVVLLTRDRIRLEQGTNLAGEPRDRLSLLDPVVPVEETRAFTPPLADCLSTTAILSASRLAGAVSAAHRLSLEYARERRQFGRPIGSFQAVAHALVQQVAAVELGAAALQSALEHEDRSSAEPAAVIARVATGLIAPDVARVAHQVHGAIGVTREYDLHRFTLRLQAWPQEFGATRWWQRRLGAWVVGAGPEWWDRTAPERR